MANSNGLNTPSIPAMAEVGSNRSLNAGLPSPATIPQPGSAKIGGSRPSIKMKVPSQQQKPAQRSLTPGTGGVVKARPQQFVPKLSPKLPLNQKTKQQRMQAVQGYVARLGSGQAESPAAFLKGMAQAGIM